MYSMRPWHWCLIGGLMGYILVHPLVMIAAEAMSASPSGHSVSGYDIISSTTLSAFSYPMLPWSMAFGILSGMIGMLLAKFRHARTQKVKLRVVMELAGAACHELNQPMQVVLGYAEMLSKNMVKNENTNQIQNEIIVQIKRMDSILKKIRNITSYETRDYVQGIKIIDIEKASEIKET